MNTDYYLNNKNEKPLDTLPQNGGFTGILRTVGVIGDSLSSGEFESVNEKNEHIYHDMFDFSWGQFMARLCGMKVYNFSRGGMTAKEYVETFADDNKFWNSAFACNAYIIALGVNDLFNQEFEDFGISDVDKDNYKNNKKTFAGYYATIISRLKQIQPRAKFFLYTVPKRDLPKDDRYTKTAEKMRAFLYDLAKTFSNTYVLDLYEYGPVYTQDFFDMFFMHGHMNPLGYKLTGDMTAAYIDYIIRHNPKDFDEIGFIGTDLHK